MHQPMECVSELALSNTSTARSRKPESKADRRAVHALNEKRLCEWRECQQEVRCAQQLRMPDWVDLEVAQGSKRREIGYKAFYQAGIVDGHSKMCHESFRERILWPRESEGRPAFGQVGNDRRELFLLRWD